MTQVYVAVGVDPTERYHESKDCPTAQGLKPALESELPEKASPCSHCAGGVNPRDLEKNGEKA